MYMQRCLDLAKHGLGRVAPNPMVGCVIVHGDKIIGEGYHQAYGSAHAEVNAINSVKEKALLKESTIYVSLEPCSHYGKTPPCADLIVEMGIPRVVIAQRDPNPKVAGQGIEKLKAAGCEVTEGVLEEEAKEFNRRFRMFHEEKRPYVILKWAMTADGYMDTPRREHAKGIFWISSPETKKLVHKWRSEESGIMIGKKTLEVDNPSLDTRKYYGRDPLRIVLTGSGELDFANTVLSDGKKTLIIGDHDVELEDENLEIITPIGDDFIDSTLEALYERNVLSVIIEGGAFTLQRYLESRIWDEARIIQSDHVIAGGLPAPQIPQTPERIQSFGRDRIYYYRNK